MMTTTSDDTNVLSSVESCMVWCFLAPTNGIDTHDLVNTTDSFDGSLIDGDFGLSQQQQQESQHQPWQQKVPPKLERELATAEQENQQQEQDMHFIPNNDLNSSLAFPDDEYLPSAPPPPPPPSPQSMIGDDNCADNLGRPSSMPGSAVSVNSGDTTFGSSTLGENNVGGSTLSRSSSNATTASDHTSASRKNSYWYQMVECAAAYSPTFEDDCDDDDE